MRDNVLGIGLGISISALAVLLCWILAINMRTQGKVYENRILAQQRLLDEKNIALDAGKQRYDTFNQQVLVLIGKLRRVERLEDLDIILTQMKTNRVVSQKEEVKSEPGRSQSGAADSKGKDRSRQEGKDRSGKQGSKRSGRD